MTRKNFMIKDYQANALEKLGEIGVKGSWVVTAGIEAILQRLEKGEVMDEIWADLATHPSKYAKEKWEKEKEELRKAGFTPHEKTSWDGMSEEDKERRRRLQNIDKIE